MRRRGARPLAELYRRFQGSARITGLPLDASAQREVAEYLVDLAARVDVKGAPEAMLLVGFLAIDAGLEVMPRWLLSHRGEANPFLDERDHALLAAFAAFAADVRAERRRAALGPNGRVRVDVFLAEQGLPQPRIVEFEKRAYRFLERIRDDADAPRVLRQLPAFVATTPPFADPPPPRWPLALSAVAALAIVAIVAAWRSLGPTGDRGAVTATAAFTVTLDGADHTVFDERFGRWRLIGPGGVETPIAPALWLPYYVEGGAAGDLDGDGRDELVLYSGVALEAFDRIAHGVYVFTRDDHGAWRRLAQLDLFVDGDAATCRALRAEIAADGVTPARARARQACPSRIGAVRVHAGALWAFELHYGRQIVRTTCTDAGCEGWTRVAAVGADITSGGWLADGRLIAGTGCWGGSDGAYAVVGAATSGALVSTWTGGRTTVVPVDGRRFAVLVGPACPGTDEQPLVAGRGALPMVRQRSLGVAELGDDGRARWLERIDLPACCAPEPRLVIIRGTPAFLAVAARASEADDAASWVRVYRLDRPLDRQTPAVVTLPPTRPSIAVADIDSDGRGDLAVNSEHVGARWFRIATTADGVTLTELPMPR